MNGARTLKIHQDGAAPGRHRPISTTGGQPLIARCTRGYKRPTTEYNNKSSRTTLKVMQWNAEGLMRKKTELEHYCPNNVNLALHNIHVRDGNFFIMGDFNSHSQSWGYDHIDARGEEIEAWQDDKNLTLINQPYDTPTFYSRCWHATSTPDIALCTEDLHSITVRKVGDQLGGSDHRPAYLTLEARTVQASTLPRWN